MKVPGSTREPRVGEQFLVRVAHGEAPACPYHPDVVLLPVGVAPHMEAWCLYGCVFDLDLIWSRECPPDHGGDARL